MCIPNYDKRVVKAAAHKDVFDVIMSESDHQHQLMFLRLLPAHLNGEAYQFLLVDLAKEYQGCAD